MPRSMQTALILAAVAFLAPISFVLYEHRDTLAEMTEIDPSRGELLFFTSPSWGACRPAHSAVAELRNQGFQIRTINLRSSPHLAGKYGIKRVPYFIYFRDGEEVRRRGGLTDADQIRQMWSDFGW